MSVSSYCQMWMIEETSGTKLNKRCHEKKEGQDYLSFTALLQSLELVHDFHIRYLVRETLVKSWLILFLPPLSLTTPITFDPGAAVAGVVVAEEKKEEGSL